MKNEGAGLMVIVCNCFCQNASIQAKKSNGNVSLFISFLLFLNGILCMSGNFPQWTVLGYYMSKKSLVLTHYIYSSLLYQRDQNSRKYSSKCSRERLPIKGHTEGALKSPRGLTAPYNRTPGTTSN